MSIAEAKDVNGRAESSCFIAEVAPRPCSIALPHRWWCTPVGRPRRSFFVHLAMPAAVSPLAAEFNVVQGLSLLRAIMARSRRRQAMQILSS